MADDRNVADIARLPRVSFIARRLLRLFLVWVVFVLAFAALGPTIDQLARLLPKAKDPGAERSTAEKPEFRYVPPGCPDVDQQTKDARRVEVQSREVTIDLSEGTSKIALTAKFDRCNPRLGELREKVGDLGVDSTSAVQERLRADIFGNISGGPFKYAFAPLQTIVEEGSSVVSVLTSAEGEPVLDELVRKPFQMSVYTGGWKAERTRITVQFDEGTGVWSPRLQPVSQTGTEARWEFSGDDRFLELQVLPVQAAPPAEQRASPPELTRALQGQLGALRALWLGFVYAIPFIALWWWATHITSAGQQVVTPALKSLCRGSNAALMLIATLMVLETADRIHIDSRWLHDHFGFYSLGWMAMLAKGAVIAFVWPAFAVFAPPAGRTRHGLLFAVLALPLLVIVFALAQFDGDVLKFDRLLQLRGPDGQMVLTTSEEAMVVLGLLVLATLLAALAVGSEAAGGWGVGVALRLLLGLGVIVLLRTWIDYPRQSLLGALLALPFGWAFARASMQWLPQPGASAHRALLLASALFAAALALPPDLVKNWSFASFLASAAWAAVRLWQIPAVILLFVWLAERGRGAEQSETRLAGAVLLFVIFYWYPRLPPGPLLLGAAAGLAALRWWVFSRRPLRDPTSRRAALLGRAIAELRTTSMLKLLRRALARGLNDKLGKGELNMIDAFERSSAADRAIERREFATTRARCRAILALNAGPRGTPWERGCHGALLAALLALPWMASYFANVARSGAPSTNAYAVSELNVILLDVARWPMLGFFFLYFYPNLRGNNGIEKGLALAVSLILPAALATLVWSGLSEDAWPALMFWSLQVFICCMSIGVGLGDLGALRKVGKGVRGLVEIYNLGTLAAWSSTLAIAVSAAATTAIASQAGTLFAVGMKFMLPDIKPASAGPPSTQTTSDAPGREPSPARGR